jgi:hypothetical protein
MAQLPFSMPVTIYDWQMRSQQATAYWYDSLALLTAPGNLNVAVLDEQRGPYDVGLYIWIEKYWRRILPYEQVANFIINGGLISIYVGLSQTIQVPSGALVYRNGIEILNATQIVPDNTGAVWLILQLNTISNAQPKNLPADIGFSPITIAPNQPGATIFSQVVARDVKVEFSKSIFYYESSDASGNSVSLTQPYTLTAKIVDATGATKYSGDFGVCELNNQKITVSIPDMPLAAGDMINIVAGTSNIPVTFMSYCGVLYASTT